MGARAPEMAGRRQTLAWEPSGAVNACTRHFPQGQENHNVHL